jgi:hypothetical protein
MFFYKIIVPCTILSYYHEKFVLYIGKQNGGYLEG